MLNILPFHRTYTLAPDYANTSSSVMSSVTGS